MKHKIVAGSFGLMVLLGAATALAAEGAAATPAPASEGGEKKIGVGGDLMFALPLGDMADATGPAIGPLVRGGYRVMPALEVTGRTATSSGSARTRAPASRRRSPTSPSGSVRATSSCSPTRASTPAPSSA